MPLVTKRLSINGDHLAMETVEVPSEVEAHYKRLLRRTGNAEYALRIAMGTKFHAPGVVNSTGDYQRTAQQNQQTVGQKFRKHPQLLKILKANVKAAGGTLSMHDTFEPALCRDGKPLDPQAVVPHDDPLGYVKRISQRRGDPCEGKVNVKAIEKEPAPPKPFIAPDILAKLMRQKAEKDPSLVSTPAKRKRLREDLINKHAPKPPA